MVLEFWTLDKDTRVLFSLSNIIMKVDFSKLRLITSDNLAPRKGKDCMQLLQPRLMACKCIPISQCQASSVMQFRIMSKLLFIGGRFSLLVFRGVVFMPTLIRLLSHPPEGTTPLLYATNTGPFVRRLNNEDCLWCPMLFALHLGHAMLAFDAAIWKLNCISGETSRCFHLWCHVMLHWLRLLSCEAFLFLVLWSVIWCHSGIAYSAWAQPSSFEDAY